MKLDPTVVDQMRIRPGSTPALAQRDPALRIDLGPGLPPGNHGNAVQELQGFSAELEAAQELLFADHRFAVLVVLQGMDTAGKDSAIKHVMSGVNPQGCEVVSFKPPSAQDLDHDFLWRAAVALPARGRIGIFNRSYYEDVLIVRVHPELLGSLHSAGTGGGVNLTQFWKHRYEAINAFEHHLVRNGTRIVKVFLHISKDEQRRRLLERTDNASKYWKFSSADLIERDYWDQYQGAYESALAATSTSWAPWYVVPADHKHSMHAAVAGILVHEITLLDLVIPQPNREQLEAILAARAKLGTPGSAAEGHA